MGEKKSIEELRAEAKRLKDIKEAKDERSKLEAEINGLRENLGLQSRKRKVLGAVVKGVKAAGKQVASDIEAMSKELSEDDKPKKKAKTDE